MSVLGSGGGDRENQVRFLTRPATPAMAGTRRTSDWTSPAAGHSIPFASSHQ